MILGISIVLVAIYVLVWRWRRPLSSGRPTWQIGVTVALGLAFIVFTVLYNIGAR